MDELIERLQACLYACNAIRGYLDDAGFPAGGNAHGQLAEIEAALTEAAAALEAAREDAERFAWYFASERDDDGALVSMHMRTISGDTPSVDDWRQAIDQARGKVSTPSTTGGGDG